MSPGADRRPLAIALMGPTASGKTALAVDWAQRLDTEIVSVDSALVYRGLDIGAAKPDAATLARAPHRLIDIRDPHERYDAGRFADDARAALHAIAGRGRVPLLVGGTGLYFRALFEGLAEMPASVPEVREALVAKGLARGWPALHADLARVDPASAARIRVGDRQRIARALEVWRVSGRSLTDWQAAAGAHARFPFRVLRLVLAPAAREILHARIARRFDAMLEEGFLDEVRRLRADPRLHPGLPAMRAVGYRQAWAHLDGRTDAATFRAQAIAATRQLAKRQLTWLRSEYAARWLDPQRQRAELDAALGLFLGEAGA